jgi:hypothetical protein
MSVFEKIRIEFRSEMALYTPVRKRKFIVVPVKNGCVALLTGTRCLRRRDSKRLLE